MKRYLTTIILACTLFIGEFHTIWNNDSRVQNWIWRYDAPMSLAWNVKLAANQLIIILYFIAWILYVPNKVNRTTIVAFLLLSIVDTFLYFYNYKTEEFGKVYVWFAFFYALVYFGKRISKWLWEKLHP